MNNNNNNNNSTIEQRRYIDSETGDDTERPHRQTLYSRGATGLQQLRDADTDGDLWEQVSE